MIIRISRSQMLKLRLFLSQKDIFMKLTTLLVAIITIFLPILCYANTQITISTVNEDINSAYLSLQQKQLKMVKATSKLKAAIGNCAIKYTSLSECLSENNDIPANIKSTGQEITSINWVVESALQGRILVDTHSQGIYHGKSYQLLGEIDKDNNFHWAEICQPNTLCFANRLKQIQQQKIQQVAQVISTEHSPSEVAAVYLTAALSNSDFNRVAALSTLHSALKLSLKHNNEAVEQVQQFQYTVLDEKFKTANNKLNNEPKKVAHLQIQISGLFNGEYFTTTKEIKLVNLQGYWLVSSFQ